MVRSSLRSHLEDGLVQVTGDVSFHDYTGGIMSVLTNQDDNHVAPAYGVPRFSLPSLVGVRFMERTIANSMISLVLGLPIKAVLEVLVLVELETHEDVECRYIFPP